MAGLDAFGTRFQRDSTGGGVYVTVANVSNIAGPSRSREAIEVTAHDSADSYREFVKGLKDGGTVTLTLNYNPGNTTHSVLDTDFEENTNRNYRVVVLPGQTPEYRWTFGGLITQLGDEFPVDGKMERSVTIKISGKPTLAAV